METTTLVRMANQIATYFSSYPEHEAVAEITKHLKSFWDPRMRQRLVQAIAEPATAARLDPKVVASVRQIAATIRAPALAGAIASAALYDPGQDDSR